MNSQQIKMIQKKNFFINQDNYINNFPSKYDTIV